MCAASGPRPYGLTTSSAAVEVAAVRRISSRSSRAAQRAPTAPHELAKCEGLADCQQTLLEDAPALHGLRGEHPVGSSTICMMSRRLLLGRVPQY
jgi:hypothetical protein